MFRLPTVSRLSNIASVRSNIASVRSKHTLPDLAYDFGALEPVISSQIMTIHHSKHHAAYVNNLNVAEEKLAEAVAKSKLNSILLSNLVV